MNYLFFFSDIQGHNLEYCHHLYDSVRNINNIKFIFIVPCMFENIRGRFIWESADNVSFEYIDSETIGKINNCTLIVRSIIISRLFKRYYKQFKPFGAFVSTLTELVPILPFLKFQKANISGIIYRIYLYEWKCSSFSRKIMDITKMWLLVRSPLFSNILILNDKASCRYLNRLYKTFKFADICDPYVPIIINDKLDFRFAYNIPQDAKIISHVGAMSSSKGTIDFLDSLESLVSKNIFLDNIYIVFAGKVSNEIKNRFYQSTNELKKHINIIIIDDFCDYDTIASICKESHLLVLPYKRCSQSSGIIGYASQFTTPVLIPNKGLLSKLVRKYKLGYLYDVNSNNGLEESLRILINQNCLIHPDFSYCNDNTVKEFSQTITKIIYES